MTVITSTQNPLVKELRQLQRTKGRRLQQRLLLEGTHLIETASQVIGSFEVFCYTAPWQAKYPDLLTVLQTQSQKSVLVSDEVLKSLATTVNPDGAIAVLKRDLCNTLMPSTPSLGLVLDHLQDPGNVGTIIRTAVATGVEGLWVSDDTVELDHPKVLRASAGSWFHLPKQVSQDLPQLLQTWQAQQIQVLATLPTATTTLWDVDFTRPTVILLSNEGQGLSSYLLPWATQQVTIPQTQTLESLNVAIAAAVLLYEVQRQRWLIKP